MKPVLLTDYLKETFGDKVYKVAIDGGFTCPNRDGTCGEKGCIFCSAKGSGDFAGFSNTDYPEKPLVDYGNARKIPSITDQIDQGIALIGKKCRSGKYIAYFQSFTNTYGPLLALTAEFTEAINHPKVVAVSIATRPDCLSKEVLDLLSRLNEIKPVWVELGLQTIHPATARYIRRGYPLSVFDEAVKALKERHLSPIVHVILGLPGEDRDMMLKTVSYVGNSGAEGIKLQLLHVLSGTDLAEEYEKGAFPVLTMEEYVSLVADCVRLLPPGMVIHRLTGDGSRKDLIAPYWSTDKHNILNRIKKELMI